MGYADFFKSFADAEEKIEIKLASDSVAEKLDTITTGSYVLDDALSSGGYPCGRIIQLYGRSGCGKTLMTLLAIYNAQLKDPSAFQLFIDAEGTFSADWAASLGCNPNKIWVVKGDQAVNGRRCFEMLLGVPKEDARHVLKGKSKEGLLDKIVSKEFNINLIILDSLGAIIPPGEDTSAIGKQNIALLSRFLSSTFKKLSLEVGKANIPMIIINHTKAGMDMYGPDHTFSGGNAYTHFLSANIFFEPAGGKDAKILNENEERIGNIIRATVEKSKFGPHPRKCEFKLNFSEGVVDLHEEIASLALKYDVVKKPTSVSHEYKEEKWVGYGKFVEALRVNKELSQEILQEISNVRENQNAEIREKQKLLYQSIEQEEQSRAIESLKEGEADVIDSTTAKRKRGPK